MISNKIFNELNIPYKEIYNNVNNIFSSLKLLKILPKNKYFCLNKKLKGIYIIQKIIPNIPYVNNILKGKYIKYQITILLLH